VLVVQPDAVLADAVRRGLELDHHVVVVAADLAHASRVVAEETFTAVLLDRDLPDGDGRALLTPLRARSPAPLVLMLTDVVDTPDWLQGLEQGVADYLVKPFTVEELTARLRAGLLRTGRAPPPSSVVLGRLRYDLLARRAKVDERSLPLSRSEAELLDVLVRQSPAVVSRELLIGRLYGPEGPPASNALDAHVSRLRRRLRLAGAGVRLLTVRGEGYQLL
jgi:DNA-binding response OmpR family regulator